MYIIIKNSKYDFESKKVLQWY